jgi:hypothetical protein
MRGIIFAAFCFIGANVSAQDRAPRQTGRISLEEVELTIRKGGAIRERKRYSQEDEYEMRKRLGVDEKMGSKPLVKPKLRFMDVQGRTGKELDLGEEVEITTTTASGVSKVKVSRHARVAKSRKFAVIYEGIGEEGEGRETGSVAFLNENGETVWQRNLPRYRMVANSKISADGSVVITVEYWTKLFGLPQDQPVRQMVVYSKTGTQLVAFPKVRSEGIRVFSGSGDFQISPDGKYIAMRVAKGKDERVAFLNSTSGRVVINEKAAFPIDIDESGKVRLGIVPGTDIETVDLRNILE